MCHVSRVTCHMSCVTCHVSHVIYIHFLFFFRTKWWALLVEGLLSTGPTPSSYLVQGDLFYPFKGHPPKGTGCRAYKLSTIYKTVSGGWFFTRTTHTLEYIFFSDYGRRELTLEFLVITSKARVMNFWSLRVMRESSYILVSGICQPNHRCLTGWCASQLAFEVNLYSPWNKLLDFSSRLRK